MVASAAAGASYSCVLLNVGTQCALWVGHAHQTHVSKVMLRG